MKILFVIESLGGGGAEKVLTTLLKHIDKSRYDVTLCPIVSTGKYIEEVRKHVNYAPVMTEPISTVGRLWYVLKYKLIYQWFPMRLVYKLFIPKNHDVEIAFCEGFATKLIAASSNRKAKKIAWVHIDLKYNPWPQKQGFFRNTNEETKAYSKFDKIVCVSRTVESSFKEVYGLTDNVHTVYNPIDVEDIRIRSNEPVVGYEASRLNLVTVGRLVHQKGYDILLQVCKRLKDNGFRFTLRILGEGEQRAELDAYIQKNDLRDYVQLIGFKSNPYPDIANSDLFICSSRSEGYSLVIAEALVLGKPVISTYCSGPNELLEEGKYGMLVENREDGEGLYEGLKQLLVDDLLLEEYRQKAAERGGFFSLASVMNEIDAILE